MKKIALATILAAFCLTGCQQYSAWDQTHERTYGVTYDADTKTGAVTMTIKPSGNVSQAPAPAGGMNDETIQKIAQIIYDASSKKQAAEILDTPDLK